MTNRHFFLLAGIMVLTGLMGLSCSVYKESYFTPTRTSTPLIEISATPSIAPSPTPIPTFQMLVSPTTSPYPTASTARANAIAFVERTGIDYSLWIANVDGSGERKLTDIERNTERVSNHLMKWSPDGKWISYISGDDLWIISPDGLVKRKVLSISKLNKNRIHSYNWSPDDSKIAFIDATGKWLLDLNTRDISEIPLNTSQLSLSWSPNGSYILLNTYTSLTVFEVNTSKVLREINLLSNVYNHCPIEHGGVTWSPNSKWVYHPVYANGTYSLQICLSGLDGSSWHIDDVGHIISLPVWDKTGDYLYFVVGEMDSDIEPNWCINQRLVRYDVEARRVETLLPLEEYGSTGFPWTVSISPNKQVLELYSYALYEDYSRPKQNKFVILDIQSLATKEFTLEFEGEVKSQLPPPTWSSDNQKIVFFLRDLVRQSYGLSYSDYGSFYSLDVKTGKVSLASGGHVVENARVSPIATSP